MISKICRDGHGEHQKVLLYTCHDDGETLQSFASRMTGTAREAEHRDAMVAAGTKCQLAQAVKAYV